MPVPSDPYYHNTVLHLPFDSDLRDKSLFGHAVTAFGNVAVTTAEKKHGAGSAVFDGSGDYFEVADSIRPTGTQNFTIETWIRVPSYPTTDVRIIYSQRNVGVRTEINFELRADGKIGVYIDGGSSVYFISSTVIPLTGC